ncbi:unnamed protein product [Prunus armeniaca]|uniref:Uncharacterized protein n=1 Tax=Prunus armeniaca TaxID=36596 RepID=A0A6J5UQA2_PRUAR|nr:unnamed protein product [Prunus armeniaca]
MHSSHDELLVLGYLVILHKTLYHSQPPHIQFHRLQIGLRMMGKSGDIVLIGTEYGWTYGGS